MLNVQSVTIALGLALGAQAHLAAWSKGMFCKNGLNNQDQPNTIHAISPLVGLKYKDWMFHGKCKDYPPPPGEFLNIPAGGSFTVEIAGSRAFTTMSYGGSKTSDWPDGEDHPNGYGDRHQDPRFPLNDGGCISSPNMHAKNEENAAGTVFAIAYKSDIHKVEIDDLVVFSVLPHTPYKRVATYQVPKLLPACPPGGCICAWSWVPDHCGQDNEYMLGYKCNVTNVSPNARRLGRPQPPLWCEGNENACRKGPKMLSIGHQAERNTVSGARDVPQADGDWRSWGYNMKLGFRAGAQEDIYDPSDNGKPSSNNGTSSGGNTPSPSKDDDNNNNDSPQSTSPTKGSSLSPTNSPKRCYMRNGTARRVRRSASELHAKRRRGALSFLDHMGF